MNETVKYTRVTREEAINFLECACRNWSHVPALSEGDVADVATELRQFAIKRSPAPELLAALIDLKEWIENDCGAELPNDLAVHAISKATGDSDAR